MNKEKELEEQLNAALDYIEKISEKHEKERAETILNAQKVRHVANKIAKERNELREENARLKEAILELHEELSHVKAEADSLYRELTYKPFREFE